MNQPLVTVNILSFNRKDDLRITLPKVFEQDYKNIEVIVVDNHSTDGTVEMVKNEFPNVILIEMEKNIGIAGWNEGFKVAKGEYILTLDDDCYIEGDTLKNIISSFARSNADIIGLNVIDPSTCHSYSLYFPGGVFSFWGCAVIFKNDVLKNNGRFDNNIFLYHHESEYMIRAMKKGLRYQFMIDEKAFHRKTPTNQIYNENRMELQLFSLVYSYLKHINRFHLIRLLFNYYSEALIIFFRIIRKAKRISFLPFRVVTRAAISAIQSKNDTESVETIENIIVKNDMNCINPLIRLCLRKISEELERKYLVNFIRKRVIYYPDFNEKYFLRSIPFIEE